MKDPLTFQHVSYLWDEAKAAELAGDEVALFLYRSNLLGADLRLTNYAGGNTSVKIQETDPVSGQPAEVMWVKGSGGDIGTLTKAGCANLYVEKLHQLKNRYRGLQHEDEMVGLFEYCLFNPKCATPSIDTPLHGLLPFKPHRPPAPRCPHRHRGQPGRREDYARDMGRHDGLATLAEAGLRPGFAARKDCAGKPQPARRYPGRARPLHLGRNELRIVPQHTGSD